MMRRRLRCLMTMYDLLGILLFIFMQRNVQAVKSKRIYLGHDRGSLASPNYPLSYPEGLRYTWVLPVHFKKIRIEFIELDLYNCYVDGMVFCEDFDYVYISGNVKEFYCNWNRPTTSITILPWTQASIVFYSGYSGSRCKGRGFKAEYTVVDLSDETTRWPATKTTTTTTTTTTTSSFLAEASVGRHPDWSWMLVLLLLAIPVILVVACLYWCCKTSRQSPAVNHEVLQTAVDNWDYQTACTPVLPRPAQTRLTVDLPPLTTTGTASRSCDGVNRQTNDDGRRPEVSAEDPPPTYDNVWEDDTLNSSQRLESPPSYEDVMRECNQIEDRRRNEGNENEFRGNVGTLNLQPRTSNEANSEGGRLEVII